MQGIVSDIIERNATPEQKADHIDIADWIIYQIQECKLMCTANHLVEAERILQRMIEKNPVLQKLVDDLDLYWSVQVQSEAVTETLPDGRRAEAKGCGERTRACP